MIHYHLTVDAMVKKTMFSKTWPDIKWRCISPTLYIHDSVLVLFSYLLLTPEQTMTELGTKQIRCLVPWYLSNENNSLTMGVDIQSGCCHLSIVAGNDALPRQTTFRLDKPLAVR